MLILTRKPGESFTITDTETDEEIIKFTLFESPTRFSRQVKVGIEASERYKILRDELLVRSPKQKLSLPKK